MLASLPKLKISNWNIALVFALQTAQKAKKKEVKQKKKKKKKPKNKQTNKKLAHFQMKWDLIAFCMVIILKA